jgi:hypothetical protein
VSHEHSQAHTVNLCGQSLDRPGHICAFFDSREQEYETLIPYFRDGVNEGELVFNIVDRSRFDDHVGRLGAGGLVLDQGAMSVRTSEETYLEGGAFDMEKMCDFIHDRLAEAQTAGKRVRTAGAMDWIGRDAPGTERAMEYEVRMNFLVPKFDCTFMCVYDISALSGETVVDILATHHYAIINGRIRENAFFIPPEVYLEQLLKRREARPAASTRSAH